MLIDVVQRHPNTMTAEPLKQQRDELRVRLHLGKADAKDEWARLETQWEALRPKLEAARP